MVDVGGSIGLSHWLAHYMPAWLAITLSLVVSCGVLVLLILGIGGIMSYVMRKTMARIGTRSGPNRVGPFGLLQFLADGVKLLSKEQIIPSRADPILFRMAPYLVVLPIILAFAPLPFGDGIMVADLRLGLLLLIAVGAASPLGEILAGWASNNKYSMLGALRAASLDVAYEIPLLITALAVVLAAGSVAWSEHWSASEATKHNIGPDPNDPSGKPRFDAPPGTDIDGPTKVNADGSVDLTLRAQGMNTLGIVKAQQHSAWFAFLMPVGLFIFVMAALAKAGLIPTDLPEAESELVSGFFTEYSGFMFGIFQVGVFVNVVFISALTVLLFLGGYTMPFMPDLGWVSVLLGVIFFALKTAVLVIFVLVTWFTLPRVRPDQFLSLGWKALFPLSLLNLAVVVIEVQFITGHWKLPFAAALGLGG